MVAVQGHSEILRLLVADQADVEQRLPNENATTPLQHASTRRSKCPNGADAAMPTRAFRVTAAKIARAKSYLPPKTYMLWNIMVKVRGCRTAPEAEIVEPIKKPWSVTSKTTPRGPGESQSKIHPNPSLDRLVTDW